MLLLDYKSKDKQILHRFLVQDGRVLPERGRLATWMASDAPLSPTEMWQALRDLHSLLVQDSTVLYLPGQASRYIQSKR